MCVLHLYTLRFRHFPFLTLTFECQGETHGESYNILAMHSKREGAILSLGVGGGGGGVYMIERIFSSRLALECREEKHTHPSSSSLLYHGTQESARLL